MYVDKQRLTRDCVSEQLASHLAGWSIETRPSVQESFGSNPEARVFALGILHIHGASVRSPEISDDISLLFQNMPNLPLVLISDLDDANEIATAFKCGVRGYLPTNLPMRQAIKAIHLVGEGGTFVPPGILSAQLGQQQHSLRVEKPGEATGFTPRQREVLRRLWQGKQNKIIAHELRMCESTVKVHVRHIMKKLHARNRTQVVLLTRPPAEGHSSARS